MSTISFTTHEHIDGHVLRRVFISEGAIYVQAMRELAKEITDERPGYYKPLNLTDRPDHPRKAYTQMMTPSGGGRTRGSSFDEGNYSMSPATSASQQPSTDTLRDNPFAYVSNTALLSFPHRNIASTCVLV